MSVYLIFAFHELPQLFTPLCFILICHWNLLKIAVIHYIYLMVFSYTKSDIYNNQNAYPVKKWFLQIDYDSNKK